MFDSFTVQTAHIYLAPEALSARLDKIVNQLKEITMNQDEFTIALNAAADKADKVAAEVTAAVAQMAAAIAAAGNPTPAQEAALARLNGALTVADEANPDAAAPADPTVAP